MKKFYLVIVVMMLISTTQAQTCPNPNGFAFPINYSGSCYVYVTATLPNADISVYSGVVRINTTEAQTNSNGSGVVFYTCNQTITAILLTHSDGTVCEISSSNIAAPAALPVKLTGFNARVNGQVADLTWTSSFELDSYQYEVQRSTNGTSYTTIGTVPAKGNSLDLANYSFTDNQLGTGAAFYRLKMVDIDGKFEYSKVVYINGKKGSGVIIKIFPNPFQSEIQLIGATTADLVPANVKLFSITGKQINFTISGSNAITIDANAPRGIYILRVKDQSYKLVKE